MWNVTRLAVPMCGLLIGSSLLGAIALRERAAQALPIASEPAISEPVAAVERATVTETAPIDRADPRAYAFVITAGDASYVQLSTRPEDFAGTPGAARMVDEPALTVVAPIAGSARFQRFVGMHVLVDGTCEATVTGLVKISRLSGTPIYAGIDAGDGTWTARQVVEHGETVLAAALDRPCTGTWARDAALPPLLRGIEVPVTPALAAAVRADLLASEAATAPDADWAAQKAGDWRASADLVVDTRMVVHPVTGVGWLFVHARVGGGCGGPNANLTGVYRIATGGAFVRTAAYSGELERIDDIIDIDADGRFELRTMTGFLANAMLTDADGTELEESVVPYFGCPC